MTRRAFVVGHPIAHSRSPMIHGHWLACHCIDGTYERVDVTPERFEAFLRGFPEAGFQGGNVTIPHKEAAFRLVDHATPRAREVGAVNTVHVEDGRIVGDNTDVSGFIAHLDETLGPGWENGIGRVLVLGAGGAARAVVAGLAERGMERILIANRTLSRAEQLADAFASARVRASDWKDVTALLPDTDLLVNTTSLGMRGQPALDVEPQGMPPGAAVADIVYVPLETGLLGRSRSLGLRTVDGLGMLLHQAVPGFARWFGVTPRVTPELRALVEADLPS